MGPLIYIHKGYSWYVPLALLNGKRFASDKVFYIGDAYGCLVSCLFGVRSYRIDYYRKNADVFQKIYRHHSSLGHGFELFCIQRWFILADFLETHSIDSCLYLDTDVLLTKNLDKLQEKCSCFCLTYAGYPAHVCFVNRLEGLKKFCQFVMDLYADPSSEQEMQEYHRQKIRSFGGGGVSDMVLFKWFQQKYPETLGDYSSICGDSPIDGSLDEFTGFERDENGFKKLVWADNIPSSITTEGRCVELSALHHQGRAKKLMSGNAARLGVGYIPRVLLASMLIIFYRLVTKIRF